MLARPLAEVGGAARRIADGDYAARVPREGPEEIASLADSFNQMAASLERQEAMRRDFIANAAHELRTPLTNLQGYLEALRDGVITADRATYESLWDEAERLVRLSRSLDALAEGDAATAPPRRSSSSTSRRPSGPPSSSPSRRSNGPGCALIVDVPDRLPARANPDHLAQVLGNLLSNAARYTPAGGHRDGPRRAPPGRPPGLDREHRRRASRRTTSIASSSASTASRSRATGRAAAPASAWRSSSSWSRPAAGGSARSRATAGRGSGSACRPDRHGTAIATIPTAIPASPTHWIGSQPLAEERDGDDDRDRRPERRREPDHPRRCGLETRSRTR